MSDDMGMVTLAGEEVRTFPTLEFRDFDATESGRFLAGRAVPYNEWADIGGMFREQFATGAFKRSAQGKAAKQPLLLWHDNKKFPIGVAHEWRHLDEGLDAVWRIDVEDPLAVEATRKAREGMLTGLSVGFSSLDVNNVWERDEMGVLWVTRREAKLHEVSLTPTPTYAGAKVAYVRTATRPDGAPRRFAQVEALRRYLDQIR